VSWFSKLCQLLTPVLLIFKTQVKIFGLPQCRYAHEVVNLADDEILRPYAGLDRFEMGELYFSAKNNIPFCLLPHSVWIRD
jgi:hypothetical protein